MKKYKPIAKKQKKFAHAGTIVAILIVILLGIMTYVCK